MAVCRRLLTFPLAEKWMDAAVAGSEDGIRKRDQRTDHPRPLCAAPRGHLIVSHRSHKPSQQCRSRYQPADESVQHWLAQQGVISPPTLPRQLRQQEMVPAALAPNKKYHPTLPPNFGDTLPPPKSKHRQRQKSRAAARTEAGAGGPRAPLWRHAVPSRRRRGPSRIWL